MVGLLFGCSELVSASAAVSGYESLTSHNSSVWGKVLGNTPLRFLVSSTFFRMINQSVLELGVKRVNLPCHSWRQNWIFVFTLPSSGIQFIVFEAQFRYKFPFLWRDSYVKRGLAGFGLTHSHAMKHLRLVGAKFAYQIDVIR